ncbi:iron (metal) dependent repressor, DtxR family [Bowdeniella nasicola]|uniref:Iron (Metal) dependent repressor, DtxR family n=1 Tax=Bowdeniella nasicola TaxID=208480 RepID=A0A1H3ZE78_9ACTO|nr:metal-dependent transcriptional regulator [Bowdeniella nasicola]SEA21818.1 iron (metal) dependent repressor, DtxR family [Bowdeniella nasicola]
MKDLIDTTEMYLKTVYELLEEGVPPLRARIAERLGHSGPTVSQTVARMERDGLLTVDEDRIIRLSDEGFAKASDVMRKHRLAERLLIDVIGLEWELVHDEACRWEHVMSDTVEAKLLGILDSSGTDPYGNPIPEVGADPAVAAGVGLLPLTEIKGEDEQHVTVARIGEPLQVDIELLTRFTEAGVLPGAEITVSEQDGIHVVGATNSDVVLEVPDNISRSIFVKRR